MLNVLRHFQQTKYIDPFCSLHWFVSSCATKALVWQSSYYRSFSRSFRSRSTLVFFICCPLKLRRNVGEVIFACRYTCLKTVSRLSITSSGAHAWPSCRRIASLANSLFAHSPSPPPPSPAPHTWDYNSKMSLLAGKVYTLAVVSSYALCLVSSVTSNVIVVIRYFALLLQSRYRAVGALKRNLAVMITFWPLGIDVKRP